MEEPKSPEKLKAVIRLNKNKIEVLCPCHKEVIKTGEGDFEKDGATFVDAGEGASRYCKKGVVVAWPEVQAKVFSE